MDEKDQAIIIAFARWCYINEIDFSISNEQHIMYDEIVKQYEEEVTA